MQCDFHYEATYALARLAGLHPVGAGVVAHASQYVDDCVDAAVETHADGARFLVEPTAHRAGLGSLDELRDPIDQIRVWIPFHFLPGGAGPDVSARLTCRPAAEGHPVAAGIRAHALAHAGQDFGLELAGIVAHVLADTFAHQGFSGVSSRRNRVDQHSIELYDAPHLHDKVLEFFKGREAQRRLPNFRPGVTAALERLGGVFAEKSTGALGHGGVATCPDEPYLRWSYRYEEPRPGTSALVPRDNRQDFLRAAAALHEFFGAVLRERPSAGDASAAVPFEKVARAVDEVLAVRADHEGRASVWRETVRSGRLAPSLCEDLPAYDARAWHVAVEAFPQLPHAEDARAEPAYRFHQAAALYRAHVLRELLPARGIVLV